MKFGAHLFLFAIGFASVDGSRASTRGQRSGYDRRRRGQQVNAASHYTTSSSHTGKGKGGSKASKKSSSSLVTEGDHGLNTKLPETSMSMEYITQTGMALTPSTGPTIFTPRLELETAIPSAAEDVPPSPSLSPEMALAPAAEANPPAEEPASINDPSTSLSRPPSFLVTAPAPVGPPTTISLPTPSGNGPSFPMSESAVMCPGASNYDLEVAWWSYAVTMEDENSTATDADEAVAMLEPFLHSQIQGLLSCDDPSTGRRLASDIGIVGMDYLPDDILEEECFNSTLPCFVYIGGISLFLEEGTDPEVAMYETRRAIQALMSEVDSFIIPNVESVEYLAPDLSTPLSIETGDRSDSVQSSDKGSSPAIPVLSAVGGLFLVLAMVAAYRFRRDRDEQLDGPSTADVSTIPGASTLAAASPPNEGGSKVSPSFAAMLPDANQSSMHTIMEDASDAGSYSRTSELIVSECGYTDDESSRDQSFLNPMNLEESSILGASGLPNYDAGAEEEDDILGTLEPLSLSTNSPSRASYSNLSPGTV